MQHLEMSEKSKLGIQNLEGKIWAALALPRVHKIVDEKCSVTPLLIMRHMSYSDRVGYARRLIMNTKIVATLLKTLGPVALGGIGGFLAVSYPAAHAALCTGGF